jgi:hypothetical protein
MLGVVWGLRKAYSAIFYSSKTGGLWKMSIHELYSLARAMELDLDKKGALAMRARFRSCVAASQRRISVAFLSLV